MAAELLAQQFVETAPATYIARDKRLGESKWVDGR